MPLIALQSRLNHAIKRRVCCFYRGYFQQESTVITYYPSIIVDTHINSSQLCSGHYLQLCLSHMHP